MNINISLLISTYMDSNFVYANTVLLYTITRATHVSYSTPEERLAGVTILDIREENV